MIRLSELQDPFHEPQIPIPADLLSPAEAKAAEQRPADAAESSSAPTIMPVPVCEVIIEPPEEAEEDEEYELEPAPSRDNRLLQRLRGVRAWTRFRGGGGGNGGATRGGNGSTGHVVPDHAAHVHKDTLAAGMDTDIRSSARRSAVPDGSAYSYPSRGSPSSLLLSTVVVVCVVGFILALMYIFFH